MSENNSTIVAFAEKFDLFKAENRGLLADLETALKNISMNFRMYSLNGENATEMVSCLRKMCERAIGEGMLTGETDAKVEEYSMVAVIQPEPLSEAELANFMRQRIENGELVLEDLPVRLARYGLMAPNAFVDEMRERMELAKDATSSWAVALTMENGTKFDWTGEADDQGHAEGQAIAEAVAKTGEQVLDVAHAYKC